MTLSITSAPTNTTIWAEDQDLDHTSDSRCILDNEDWTYTVIPVYILVISVLGIVLNVFVLMVFCLHKKSCSTPEIYLSNLAAADLLLVSFLPFHAVSLSNRHNWTFGQAMCKVSYMSIIMNSFCSIYFLVLVSIDRFLALVHPLSYKRIRRSIFAKLGCLLVWILGFLFTLPALIYRELLQHNNRTLCSISNLSFTTKMTVSSVNSVFGFIIPVFIISFCTIKIIKALKNRLVHGVNAKKTDQKATTLILAVLLAFLICWVPFHLMRFLYLPHDAKIITECKTLRILYICGQICPYLAYFNSVLNPILYVVVGKNFRQKVKELFSQWNHERITTVSHTSTSTNLSRVVNHII
uniref:Bradykinin receptor B2 n=2 Tax=Kryptolebias marmoratus TaxID=37003 RepID=A0A3Q3AS48_KRYMA